MFSEKDFKRLWFLYKTEGKPKGVSSTRSEFATTFLTQHSMTGSRRHRKRLHLSEVGGIPEESIRQAIKKQDVSKVKPKRIFPIKKVLRYS